MAWAKPTSPVGSLQPRSSRRGLKLWPAQRPSTTGRTGASKNFFITHRANRRPCLSSLIVHNFRANGGRANEPTEDCADGRGINGDHCRPRRDEKQPEVRRWIAIGSLEQYPGKAGSEFNLGG